MHPRLGLDLAREGWPTPACLAAREAAGFEWLQIHAPSRKLLADRAYRVRHARALRAALDHSGSRVVLHAPGELTAGTAHGDRALLGLLDYAGETGAEIVVYHGCSATESADRATAAERARLEERALGRLARRAGMLGIVVAIENVAPPATTPPPGARACHDPLAIRDLVRRVDSPACGMALDVGHLNLLVGGSEADTGAVVAACAPDVVLWNVHDNRAGAPDGAPDLHLIPGEGSVPWPGIAPFVRDHRAPLVVEVAPVARDDLSALAAATTALLLEPAPVAV